MTDVSGRLLATDFVTGRQNWPPFYTKLQATGHSGTESAVPASTSTFGNGGIRSVSFIGDDQ